MQKRITECRLKRKSDRVKYFSFSEDSKRDIVITTMTIDDINYLVSTAKVYRLTCSKIRRKDIGSCFNGYGKKETTFLCGNT